MSKVPHSKNKFFLLVCLICVLCIVGCKTVKEDITTNTEQNSREIVTDISSILGCDQRTAQSIITQVESQIDESLDYVENNGKTDSSKLILYTESGEKYIAFISLGNSLESIYKGDENGECLYWVID